MLTLEHIDDLAALERLGEEWDGLLAASDADSFFLTREWLLPWCRHMAGNRRLRARALRSGGELIALAPWCTRSVDFAARPALPCVEPLGAGQVGSDYLDVIVRRGHEAEALDVLADDLGRTGLVVTLRRAREQGCLTRALADELGRRDWTTMIAGDGAAPFISLHGSFEAYLAGLGSKHRATFRRRLRDLEQRHQLELVPVTSEAERGPALETLMALHDARWRGVQESEAFSTPALRAFHDEVSQRALARGWLRLYLLRLDGTPAAAVHAFRYRDVVHYYQAGFDPAFAAQSVGLVALGLAIRAAYAESALGFDMLHGDAAYKLHWTNGVRPLQRFELYPPGVSGWVYRQVAALEQHARRLGRSVLERTRAKEAAA